MEDEMQKYIDKLIEQGYIDKDGTPLKCYCESEELEDYNKYYEEHWCVEYSVRCKACGKKLGHWAYGYWMNI